MSMKQPLLLCASISAMSLAAASAQAQTKVAGATILLDELVVTAERREERLQDVPIAISAFTDSQRELIGIKSVADMANFAPGVNYTVGGDRMSIRGIGKLPTVMGSDPGVAGYLDGVYQAGQSFASASTIFVERVEILRGPQGTLYGRNSIGGALNAVSKRPSLEFKGEVRAGLQNYDRTNFEVLVSGPITDNFRFLIAADKIDQRKGYFHNVGGGPSEGGVTDRYDVMAQLEADLGDNTNVWLKWYKADYTDRERGQVLVSPYYTGATLGFPNPLDARNLAVTPAPIANPALTDRRAFSTNRPNHSRLSDNNNLALQISHQFDGAVLKYVGGFQTYKLEAFSDGDNTNIVSAVVPNPIRPFEISPDYVGMIGDAKTYWSNELTLSSTGEGRTTWIVGLYQFHEENDQRPLSFFAPKLAALDAPCTFIPVVVCGPPAAANPQRLIYDIRASLKADAYAAFGQFEHSFNDRWRVTGGLRYSVDEKSGTEKVRLITHDWAYEFGEFAPATDLSLVLYGLPLGLLPDTEGYIGRTLSKRRWEGWSGMAGVDWTPRQDLMIYAKYSRGYKSGGLRLADLAEQPAVAPEHVDAFELGLKARFGPSLQTNLSAYYYDYRDLQAVMQTPVKGLLSTTTKGTFVNLDKARTLGVELEAIWAPTKALQFTFAYAYLDATIRKSALFVDSTDPGATQPGAKPSGASYIEDGVLKQPQTLAGNALPNSPRNKLALTGVYTLDLPVGPLSLAASYIYKDAVRAEVFNRADYEAPSYDRVDLRATWTDPKNRLTVIAFVANAFDKEQIEAVSFAAQGGVPDAERKIVLLPPRTYGVEFQYRF